MLLARWMPVASIHRRLAPRAHVVLLGRTLSTQAQRISEMGGVRFMFLTHQDDVGDHVKWTEHFGAERIMHEGDRKPKFEVRVGRRHLI